MSNADIRVVVTTLTDLHAGPSFLTEMRTQVTNGVELEILKQDGEWCEVRQRDGYWGWAYGPFLASVSTPKPTHLVAAAEAVIHSEPNSSEGFPTTRIPIGTALRVTDQLGEWSRLAFAGEVVITGWTRTADLRPLAGLPLDPQTARQQIIADARRLTGVYYLWGGCTAWGIDCSGLSQLCHRLSGYAIPRDAGLQFPAGRPVEPPYRPGDLLFFHSETSPDKITHVGISTGGRRMIHSSRTRNGVHEEDLETELTEKYRNRFAGARSFLPDPR